MAFFNFYGKRYESASNFLDDLEMAILVSGRDEEEVKLRAFPLVLREEAKVWFQGLEQRKKGNWGTLREAFMGRFGGGCSLEEIWRKLSSLQQISPLSYLEYEAQFLKLWAEWENTLEQGERAPNFLQKERFLDGLSSPLKEKVKGKFPRTFEEAMQLAQLKDRKLQLQAYLSRMDQPQPQVQNVAHEVPTQVPTTPEDPHLELLQRVTNQLDNLSINMVQGAQRQQYQPLNGERGPNDQRQQRQRQQRRDYFCYNCGEDGHEEEQEEYNNVFLQEYYRKLLLELQQIIRLKVKRYLEFLVPFGGCRMPLRWSFLDPQLVKEYHEIRKKIVSREAAEEEDTGEDQEEEEIPTPDSLVSIPSGGTEDLDEIPEEVSDLAHLHRFVGALALSQIFGHSDDRCWYNPNFRGRILEHVKQKVQAPAVNEVGTGDNQPRPVNFRNWNNRGPNQRFRNQGGWMNQGNQNFQAADANAPCNYCGASGHRQGLDCSLWCKHRTERGIPIIRYNNKPESSQQPLVQLNTVILEEMEVGTSKKWMNEAIPKRSSESKLQAKIPQEGQVYDIHHFQCDCTKCVNANNTEEKDKAPESMVVTTSGVKEELAKHSEKGKEKFPIDWGEQDQVRKEVLKKINRVQQKQGGPKIQKQVDTVQKIDFIGQHSGSCQAPEQSQSIPAKATITLTDEFFSTLMDAPNQMSLRQILSLVPNFAHQFMQRLAQEYGFFVEQKKAWGEETRTSNRSRRSTSSTGADVHADEEVEILMQSPTSRQQGERVTIEHQFIDFKVDIPHSKGFHAQWLQSINLLEYARLPWSRWRHTTEVGMHVSNLVENNGLVGYGVYLSAELVSKVFGLQQGEENHVDRALEQIMDREFGKCEGTRGYYLIKNVVNLDRALQIKWFLERFLLLVKLEYVSRENYAIISTAEQGRNFGWASMLYDRLHSEVFCKDKRKTQRSTKIGPLITAIFSYVRNNAILRSLSEEDVQANNLQGAAANIQATVNHPAETPESRKKIREDIKEDDTQERVKGIYDDLLTAGYSHEICMDTLNLKKSELTDLPPSGSKSVKKVLRIKKRKVAEMASDADQEPVGQQSEGIQTANSNFEDIPYARCLESVKLIGDYVGQQKINSNLLINDNEKLKQEVAYLKLEMKNKTVSDEEVNAIKTKLRSTESQLECALKKINFYSEQMHRRESSARIYKEWMMEWDNIFHQQLEVLSTVNVTLEAENKVLLDRVSACKEVEKKIKECAKDELEIEGCFMSGTNVDTMKMELQKHLEPIWTEMKEKLLEVSSRPYKEFAEEENKEEYMLLQTQYTDLQEKYNLLLKKQLEADQSTEDFKVL
ncbi:hypothetical protein L7F22_012903 [Adiantum nelumboides]|nr:hypothetical protein [Adiantum nelumboides]